MPRFYFDINDADRFLLDEDGEVLLDCFTAARHAMELLPEIAHNQEMRRDRRDLIVTVRDQNGDVFFTAALALQGIWLKR